MAALKYRPEIDGLRALAVLSVLLYHVSPQSLPGGFLGVDVFFVISGYLISLIVFREHAAGTFSFTDFYARRFRRLFPALAVVLLATLLFGAFALFADEYQRLGKHASFAVLFFLNFQLMHEAGYFDVVSHSKPLLHLWSLSVEEQFYLVWPALLIVLIQFRLRIGPVIGLLLICSFAFAIHAASRNPDVLYFHPMGRFWELIVGAALAYYHHSFGVLALPAIVNRAWIRDLFSILGLSTIIAALCLFNDKIPHPSAITIIPLLGVAVLIASGTNSAGNRLLSFKPIVWLGLISYPLYLWHWPVLSYIRIIESGRPAELLVWIGAGFSLLLAALTYRFIEMPMRNVRTVRSAVIGLGAGMAALLLASFGVSASDGFPDRSVVAYVKAVEAQMTREPATDEACLGLFPQGVAPAYCRQHLPGPRMIGTIGDSHAHVLYPGIAEQAERAGYGVLLLANSGCPPLVGAVTGKTDSERKDCTVAVKKVLSGMLADQRIKHVIVATRGPIYLTGKGYGPAEADYDYPPIAYGRPPEKRYIVGADPFSDGLFQSIHMLLQSGKSVSYLLQPPELGVPPRNCLGRPLTLSTKATCSVQLKEYRERMKEYRAIVAKIKVDLPALQVWDPLSLFCDTTYCQGMIGNSLMYADDDHLSIDGSRYVAEHFFPNLSLRVY